MTNPFEEYVNELPAIDDTWSHPTARCYYNSALDRAYWRAVEESREQIERLFRDALDRLLNEDDES